MIDGEPGDVPAKRSRFGLLEAFLLFIGFLFLADTALQYVISSSQASKAGEEVLSQTAIVIGQKIDQIRESTEFLLLQSRNFSGRRIVDLSDFCPGCPISTESGVETPSRVEIRSSGGVPLLVGTSPIRDEHGGVTGFVHVARDLSEQKKLESQLVMSRKMEAVGKLAGGIAHDFNNLLTAIIGYSEFLDARFTDGDPSKREIREIRKAADHAASLTQQLLAYSRKQILQPRVIGINSVVSEMDKMLRRLIGEHIDLATKLDAALWKVKADPGQISQVVMNLAINARDAMPGGGKLTLETGNVFLDEEDCRRRGVMESGPYVMLAVSDTGTGMDEETITRMFDPFFTTKKMGKGTGLGLSTVYGIVKQSRGYIWVYSEPGRGSGSKPCSSSMTTGRSPCWSPT